MNDGLRWEFIYNQINGLNGPDVCEWVKDETAEDGALALLVEQIYGVRNRLCKRLGADPDTDKDFGLLVSGLENLSRTCGKLMYHYGYQDGVQMGTVGGIADALD